MWVAWYSDFAEWLLDILLWLPRYIFSVFMDLLSWLWAIVFDLISPAISGWHSTVGPVFAGPIGYWADVTMAGTGIGMILVAYLTRFIIRRLPIVG